MESRFQTVKILLLVSLFSLSAIVALSPLVVASSAPSNFAPQSSATPKFENVCAEATPQDFNITGIYANGTKAAFVEDYDTGQIYYCTGGGTGVEYSLTLVTSPPAGTPSGDKFWGMGGIVIDHVLKLVLSAEGTTPGFWLCEQTNSHTCMVYSRFITLPSSLCANMRTAVCSPYGITIDSKQNVYYADPNNGVVVECLLPSNYATCKVLYNFSPYKPEGIFRDSSGNIWVSDASCTGNVWVNGAALKQENDSLTAITVTTAQNPSKQPRIFVADTGTCTDTRARILDLSDGSYFMTPYPGPGPLPGLSTTLQYTTFINQVVDRTVGEGPA